MITQETAQKLVYDKINAPDPWWPKGHVRPEMVIVRVDDHPLGWVVYWASGDPERELAGNGPYLVSKNDGSLRSTGTRPPIKDRIAEAEQKLRAHLAQPS